MPARNNRVMRTAAEDSVPDVTRHADACTRAVGRRKATADAQWAQRRVNVQGTAGALRPPHARTHRLGPRKKKYKKKIPRAAGIAKMSQFPALQGAAVGLDRAFFSRWKLSPLARWKSSLVVVAYLCISFI